MDQPNYPIEHENMDQLHADAFEYMNMNEIPSIDVLTQYIISTMSHEEIVAINRFAQLLEDTFGEL